MEQGCIRKGGTGGSSGTSLLLGCPSTFSNFTMICAKMEKNFFLPLCRILSNSLVTVPGVEPAPEQLTDQ